MADVSCACGHMFSVGESFAGGIVNCPKCGHAVDVPGLRDPAWRALQVLGILIWSAATFGAICWGGFLMGILVGLAAAGILWGVSRCF
jgi:hypothetical protein